MNYCRAILKDDLRASSTFVPAFTFTSLILLCFNIDETVGPNSHATTVSILNLMNLAQIRSPAPCSTEADLLLSG